MNPGLYVNNHIDPYMVRSRTMPSPGHPYGRVIRRIAMDLQAYTIEDFCLYYGQVAGQDLFDNATRESIGEPESDTSDSDGDLETEIR